MILFPIFFYISPQNLWQNGSIGIAFVHFGIVITNNKLKFPLSDSIYLIEYLKKIDVREDMENGEHFTVWVYDIDPELLQINNFIHPCIRYA